MTDPPTWLVRATTVALRSRGFVRAPIGLYRRGLGWLLGRRILMLEHRGRRSGLVRRVVLEVIGHPLPGRYVVVAGFGERADWLRNVRAHPEVRVSVGRLRSAPATARELPRQDTTEVLESYQRAHPLAWAVLSRTIEQSLGTDLESLPVVALDLS
ncbi:nitroreductase family deazaflavin-dependent oxidoreductase [Pseudactinotalea sp.]|uniref:nitroreductase family deazaflavin-dependent oxidoreductase n=1 Tax=Pseudactinotalea sp. TaxID=1926260 RepID=UPI003B3A4C93